jgi:uncharacterized protein (TIGR02611 family)
MADRTKRSIAHPKKLGILLLGWLLVLAGIAALVLPGPGLLLLLVGLVVLSQEYDWAERRVEPVKEKAFEVAEAGVQSILRIAMSALAAVAVIAVGVGWGLDPEIPTVWKIGPHLPFAGWAVASSLILSGLIALGLLVYSIRRFRG